ncbi:MAG TPA: GntR family transcriptional regulator [Thermoguttaceae bacterium]|nr:GntR family transcriptional regulator [Thermoguttaceae bacterium]
MSIVDSYNPIGVEDRLRELDLHGSEDARPKYERLRSFIAGEVGRGHLKVGVPLPSEQRLSEILRVARTTVRQALAELEKDGLIERRHGAGTFVNEVTERTHRVRLDVFAMVVPEAGTGFWPSLQTGLLGAAMDVHKQILVCNTENDLDKQAHIFLQLVQKRVAGVVLAPTSVPPTPAYQVNHLRDHGIPVVLCHRSVQGVDAPLLAIPFVEVGRMAGRLLVENGHRRVAFFSMHQRVEASMGYEAGLREVLMDAGGVLPEELTYGGETTSPDANVQNEAVFKTLRRMLDGPNPPTAIMASFDPLAERIYLMLGQLGLRAPEDISLIGVGGTDRSGALAERLTSITIDEIDLGRRAAHLLQEMCDGHRPFDDAEKTYVPIGLAKGSTVRKAK